MPATKHRRKGRRRPGYTPLVVALPGPDELHDSMIADARLREVLGDDWLDRELNEDEVAALAARLIVKGYALD
jgi:hypothetical protein